MGRFFEKMISEFMKEISWQWWVCQAFALASIIFCITAMQQKTRTNILWHRSIFSLLLFGGVCFLGHMPAMIMIGVAFLRNLVLLILSFRETVSKVLKWSIFATLAISLIALNIIFWENYLSLLSIAVGLAFLTAFIQQKPVNIRRISIAAAGLAIVFYTLSFLPINAVINISVLISSIVGLIRHDKKKKKTV